MEENKLATQLLFCSLFTALVLLSCPALIGGASPDFNYNPASDRGPAHWGDLEADWYKCKNGTMQSPINLLDTDKKVYHSGLQTNYHTAKAFLLNTGHGVELVWRGNAGYNSIDQTRYSLLGCNFHFPSEHIINGQRYDLEVQLLHKARDHYYAVVAILYQFGNLPDPFLGDLLGDKRLFMGETAYATPNWYLIDDSKYFGYNGSFTTPPCAEDVRWIVIREIRTVEKKQVHELLEATPNAFNARPLQPRNNRPVKLYIKK